MGLEVFCYYAGCAMLLLAALLGPILLRFGRKQLLWLPPVISVGGFLLAVLPAFWWYTHGLHGLRERLNMFLHNDSIFLLFYPALFLIPAVVVWLVTLWRASRKP